MDTQGAEEQVPTGGSSRRRRLRAGLVAGGAAVGLILAGLGIAAAQTQPPPPGPNPAAPGPAPPLGGSGRHGKGMGMGIHGEFVTRAPGGGFQTVASQVGEVTDVSASSIAVRSEDGFSRTYGVDDNTLVNAGNQGIADVKKGDQVRIMAVVRDGKAQAVKINDATQVDQLRGRWMPPRPDPGGRSAVPPRPA